MKMKIKKQERMKYKREICGYFGALEVHLYNNNNNNNNNNITKEKI